MSATPSDRIARYLAGTMSAAERAQFEAAVEQDEALRAQLTEQIHLRLAIRQAGIQAEAERLAQTYGQADAPPAAPVRALRWRRYAVAAAVALLLLGTVAYLLLRTPQPDPQQLLATYYEVPAVPDLQRSAPLDSLATVDSLRHRADQAFAAGRYAQALATYQQLDLSQLAPVQAARVRWFMGICHYEAGRLPAARAAWTQAATVLPEPEWYLALSYLRSDEPAEARRRLQTIAQQPRHPYQNLATRLLQRWEP